MNLQKRTFFLDFDKDFVKKYTFELFLSQLDIVKTFSKNKVKRKVRTLKSFAERNYAHAQKNC